MLIMLYKKLKVSVITLNIIMLWVKVITEMCPDTLYLVILCLGQTIVVTKGRSQQHRGLTQVYLPMCLFDPFSCNAPNSIILFFLEEYTSIFRICMQCLQNEWPFCISIYRQECFARISVYTDTEQTQIV